MLLDMVAGETANELNSLSSTTDQKQTGKAMPSLIQKNGPKEMNVSVSWTALYKGRSSLSLWACICCTANHSQAENQFE